jgi:DNA-binding IscR family transcriptional regulator
LSHALWESLSDQISNYLASITLSQVVSDYENSRSEQKVVNFDVI